MSRTVMPHAENENTRHTGQPQENRPPSVPNPDKMTNSGYPAGGDLEQPGKDAYGRDPDQRRQAGLPPVEGGGREQDEAAPKDRTGGR